jgi:CheY-like chemotaxis protein
MLARQRNHESPAITAQTRKMPAKMIGVASLLGLSRFHHGWHGAWNDAHNRMATLTSFSPRRGCILLVEDRDDVRGGLAQLLEFNGYLVEEARDGHTALTFLEREGSGIALLVLDLNLPGTISGRDIRGRMLTNPTTADVPTIVVTASEIDAPGRAGLCPTAWLEKPFRFEQLLDLVKRFVIPEATPLAGTDESTPPYERSVGK